jgi:hypothetical protein
MRVPGRAARPLLACIFAVSGVHAVRRSESKVSTDEKATR